MTNAYTRAADAIAAIDLDAERTARTEQTARLEQLRGERDRCDARLEEIRVELTRPGSGEPNRRSAYEAWRKGGDFVSALSGGEALERERVALKEVRRELMPQLEGAETGSRGATTGDFAGKLAAAGEPIADVMEARAKVALADLIAVYADSRAAANALGNSRLDNVARNLGETLVAAREQRILPAGPQPIGTELAALFDKVSEAIGLARRGISREVPMPHPERVN